METIENFEFYPIDKKDKDISTDIEFTLLDLKVIHIFLLEEYNSTPHIQEGRLALKTMIKKLDDYLAVSK